MTLHTEPGTIIAAIKTGGPYYQVKLDSGSVVIVSHEQVQPPRATLLARGVRLLVAHELGVVQWASSDLLRGLPVQAVKLRGRVTAVIAGPQEVTYRVQLQSGLPRLVPDHLVTPQVGRELLVGAILELTVVDEALTAARLFSEKLAVTIQAIDVERRIVSVAGGRSERLKVRLPSGEDISQLKVGGKLEMEYSYDAEGQRRVALSPPAPTRPLKGPELAPTHQETSLPGKPEGSPGRQVVEKKRASPLLAEYYGIDPAYLAARQREGHRFEIMAFLNEHRQDGLVEWYRMREEKNARFASPIQPLAPGLQTALRGAEPAFVELYNHQARALDSLRAGRSLVIVTPTASGKTLCYNPAIFERFARGETAHALYIFPLNALMTDQKQKIDELRRALAQQGQQVEAEVLRGGLGKDRRIEIARRSPNIIAANPEMLGVMLDEAPQQWGSFFAGLKYVILDEVHAYRGIFGMHMAGLLRRLLLTARRSGASPQYILSSATVSNPLDLAVRLTGLPEASFDLLDERSDGSQQACKHWAVLNPDWGTRYSDYHGYLTVAALAMVELLCAKDTRGHPSPLNTILFARSISDVNRTFKMVQEGLHQRAPALAGKVRKYVSAELTIDAKQDIYEGLRSGKLMGVVSTNALEAGIDIGHLDACIIAGFPFSVMRMRQMAGRVGRQAEGLVLFTPHPGSSLDEYYRDHPDLLLNQPPEVFVVDPENAYIARKHINAAAYALSGLEESELALAWGERAKNIASQAVQDGVMRRQGTRYYGTRRAYDNLEDVYAINGLRSNMRRPYAVCLDHGPNPAEPHDAAPVSRSDPRLPPASPQGGSRGASQSNGVCRPGPECFDPNRKARCPENIVLLDQEYIYRDCHPGAIYEAPDGRLYRITRFDDSARTAWAAELPERTLERTYAEEDTSIEIVGVPRAKKSLPGGVEMAWGEVVLTRSFTGYFTHSLLPGRRCRHCRKEYDETINTCPDCGRATETFFRYSKPERHDFPEPHRQTGFKLVLKTAACWLTTPAALETRLEGASPCKLPGDKNGVLRWLQQPLALDRLPPRLRLTDGEKTAIAAYQGAAAAALASQRPSRREALLFPAVYGQCLLHALRQACPEPRALELFQALTAYPVTDNLTHVCRQCQTSVLFQALHTLEHIVLMRYPSLALGDQADLGTYTTLGHSQTGAPTIFWFDDYEGGMGAAEKVYDKILPLIEAGAGAVSDCACRSLEGCPRCTQIAHCDSGNQQLSKPALLALAGLLLGRDLSSQFTAYSYRANRGEEFNRAYNRNEFAGEARGVGEEATTSGAARPRLDPYHILRVQPSLHAPVLHKAFEVRSSEISEDVPPVSAVELNQAYQQALALPLAGEWNIRPGLSPYQVLELLPAASPKMVQQVYRVIARLVHPDANPDNQAWANEMMKLVNQAYDKIISESGKKE